VLGFAGGAVEEPGMEAAGVPPSEFPDPGNSVLPVDGPATPACVPAPAESAISSATSA
jgi:hypothetical protein